jgi:hypothetical protein
LAGFVGDKDGSVRFINADICDPQVLVHARPLDALNDVYSYGLMLWELITGILEHRRAGVARDAAAAHQSLFAAAVCGEAAASAAARVPEPLLMLTQQCMDPVAERRPQFADLVVYLRTIVGAE